MLWHHNGLLPDLQSAYLVHHSTETALLKVLSDILLALDSGNLAMLTLSAAFDSVDHETLLRRLLMSYGLEGKEVYWTGLGRISAVTYNTSIQPCPVLHHPSYCPEYLKVRSSGQSCSSCTLLIFCHFNLCIFNNNNNHSAMIT